MPKAKPEKKSSSAVNEVDKKSRISQSDVPGYSLEQALRIPKAIVENYASKPTPPLQVAKALNMQPNSSYFRQLCGASIAYGLTSGGYNASEIGLEPLGKRILKPLDEGDDAYAMREAFLKPRIVREFMQKYDGSPIPREDIVLNVIETMGVPADRSKGVFQLILDTARSLSLITEIKGKEYVDLSNVPTNTSLIEEVSEYNQNETIETQSNPTQNKKEGIEQLSKLIAASDIVKKKRVFITHGKNKTFVEPIKKLLNFGELEPVVSVERQSVSQPVPDKVLNEMRTCGAAIIHVDAEMKLIDSEAKEHIVLNPNVLIEIGAAMALYGRRFILLVKSGVTLPSNLQGLFEVRYNGESLDGDATIRLLEAINAMKNAPSPTENSSAQDN